MKEAKLKTHLYRGKVKRLTPGSIARLAEKIKKNAVVISGYLSGNPLKYTRERALLHESLLKNQKVAGWVLLTNCSSEKEKNVNFSLTTQNAAPSSRSSDSSTSSEKFGRGKGLRKAKLISGRRGGLGGRRITHELKVTEGRFRAYASKKMVKNPRNREVQASEQKKGRRIDPGKVIRGPWRLMTTITTITVSPSLGSGRGSFIF